MYFETKCFYEYFDVKWFTGTLFLFSTCTLQLPLPSYNTYVWVRVIFSLGSLYVMDRTLKVWNEWNVNAMFSQQSITEMAVHPSPKQEECQSWIVRQRRKSSRPFFPSYREMRIPVTFNKSSRFFSSNKICSSCFKTDWKSILSFCG